MATLSATIVMRDQGSMVLNRMNQIVGTLNGSFERLNRSVRNLERMNINGLQTGMNNANIAAQNIDSSFEQVNGTMNRTNIIINNMTASQNTFNNQVREGNTSANSLMSTLKKVVGAYLGIQGLKMGMNATDEFVSNNARLDLIKDEGATQEELMNKIYHAAQRSKGELGAMSNTVSKLGLLAGDSFSGNDELIHFTELMQKSFKVSGASTQEASNGMYQLTQAMASGRLQGDEFKSILENAPMLANAIAEYTGVGMEGLKELSSSGGLSADIIKNALFMAGDEIEKKFNSMPDTFAGVWSSIKNTATMQFSTIMKKVSQGLNSETAQKIIQGITNAIHVLAMGVSVVVSVVGAVGSFFVNNWSLISPIIGAIVSAIGAYIAVLSVLNAITLKNAIVSKISQAAAFLKAVITDKMTIADFKAIAAQWGLNTALLACPITWIVLGIIALIAIIYIAVAAFNKISGKSVSATGIICGAIFVAAGFIINQVLAILRVVFEVIEFIFNYFVSFANFVGNFLNDPVASVIKLFSDLADNVLGVFEKIASAMDKLFGTDFAATIKGFRATLETYTKVAMEEYGNGTYAEKFKELDISQVLEDLGIDINGLDLGVLWDKCNGVGVKIDDFFKDKLDLGELKNEFDYGEAPEFPTDVAAPEFPTDVAAPEFPTDVAAPVMDTADNTKKMADSAEVSQEEIKYLRDIAERDVINRFTTAEVKFDFTSNANINNTNDIDGIMKKFEEKIEEIMTSTAEGVYL